MMVASSLPLYIDIALQGLDIADGGALVDHFLGETEVVVECGVDQRPTILVAGSGSLPPDVVEDMLPVAIHGGDVAEKSVPLRL